MRIAVCDDETEITKQEVSICQNYFGETASIVVFDSGLELLEYPEKIDLLILDIEMPEKNGIAVKEQMQWEGKETLIIFVTDHEEYMSKAFGNHVLGFVSKRDLFSVMPCMLQTASHMLQNGYMIKGCYDSREIMYIQAEHNYVRLCRKEGSWLVRCSISQLEKELESYDFIRVHRKYLVNLRWIVGQPNETVALFGNHQKLPISIRLRHTVRQRYMEYCEKHAKYC